MSGFCIKATIRFEAQKLGNTRAINSGDSAHKANSRPINRPSGDGQTLTSLNKRDSLRDKLAYFAGHILWPLIVVITGEIAVGLVFAHLFEIYYFKI